MKGQKRIIKLMNGCQGHEAIILDEQDKIVCSRQKSDKSALRYPNRFVTQAYCDAVQGSFNQFRVFNVFTSSDKAIAMSVREAPNPFVGGNDTGTRLRPIIVRPDQAIRDLNRPGDVNPIHPYTASNLLKVLVKNYL